MLKRYTIKDVAKIAGVSPRTVSRVVNGEGYVKEETKEKILKIINETGYQVNPIARSLRNNKTDILIVFVAENEMSYIPQFHNVIIRYLNKQANELGYKLIVSKSNPYEAEEKKNDGFYLLKNGFADGAFIFDILQIDSRLEYLVNRKIPFVIIGKDTMYQNSSFVNLDNVKAGYMGTEHLLKRGKKNILFFLGGKSFTVNQDRAQGYIQACKDHNVNFDIQNIKFGITTPEMAYQEMKRILKNESSPDAVFVSGDERAMGVYHAIQESGLKIPDEIAVLGIDNIPISKYCYPALSTIDQSSEEMAREAVDIIDKMLQDGQNVTQQRKILQPKLIIRKST